MPEKDPVVLLTFKNGNRLDEITFAECANKAMRKEGKDSKWELAFPKLTTSKLRSIYSMIMNLYAKIDSDSNFERFRGELQYLKVKMAYESGRDRDVKTFLHKTHLMIAIDHIKSYDQFTLYCRYAESLVAYFKFYDGRD